MSHNLKYPLLNVALPYSLHSDDEEEDEEDDLDKPQIIANVESRTIRLFGEVNKEMSFHIWNFLNLMQKADKDEFVDIVINSEGGSTCEMFAIVDAIKLCSCPVRTIGTGLVASAATLIIAAGAKGHRFLSPNCTVMVHEISWGVNSNLTNMKLVVDEAERLENLYKTLMAQYTGKSLKHLEPFYTGGTDSWMDAKTAIKQIGLADKILKKLA